MTKDELLRLVQSGQIRFNTVKYDSYQQSPYSCMSYASLEVKRMTQSALQKYGTELAVMAMFNDTRVCSFPEEHRSSWYDVREAWEDSKIREDEEGEYEEI